MGVISPRQEHKACRVEIPQPCEHHCNGSSRKWLRYPTPVALELRMKKQCSTRREQQSKAEPAVWGRCCSAREELPRELLGKWLQPLGSRVAAVKEEGTVPLWRWRKEEIERPWTEGGNECCF